MSNTKQILPEDGLAISRDWLEKQILHYEKEAFEYPRSDYVKGCLYSLKLIKQLSTPLTPIVEDAFKNGWICRNTDGCFTPNGSLNKSSYLSQPITIKLENDAK